MLGYVEMRIENYFELAFCRKDLELLDFFVAFGLDICKLSFGGFMLLECYILRKLVSKNLS